MFYFSSSTRLSHAWVKCYCRKLLYKNYRLFFRKNANQPSSATSCSKRARIQVQPRFDASFVRGREKERGRVKEVLAPLIAKNCITYEPIELAVEPVQKDKTSNN